MTWHRPESVTLASGRVSSFKIECDDLTDEELRAACAILAKLLPPFARVVGVPRGGVRVAQFLEPFAGSYGGPLVVDDVWTTGGSVRRFLEANDLLTSHVAVLFARGQTPPWVTALWTIHPRLWDA